MPGTNELIEPGTFEKLGIDTIPDIIDYAVTRHGPSVAMKKRHSWGYQAISYQEFGKLVSFLGSGLIDKGLARGDRVALMAENSPEWMLVYAAVTSCGAVIVPLDTQLNENELTHVLLHSESKFIVVSPRIYSGILDDMNLRDVRILVLGEKDPNIKDLTVSEVMAGGKAKISGGDAAFFRIKSEVKPEDTAAICYTSGTTGDPKGAVLLQSNLVSNIESTKSILPVRDDDVFLCLLPLHHTFSTMGVFLIPLSSGSTIVFARSRKPKLILEDVIKEGITILVGVPLLFEHIAPLLTPVKDGKKRGLSFFRKIFLSVAMKIGKLFGKKMESSAMAKKVVSAGMEKIRFCVSGAAALRPDVEYAFFAAGLPILQGYGMTEASPVIAVNPFDRPKKGTIGPALPGVQVEIDSPGEDGIGEIIVKGPNVMKEYYKNAEATGKTLRRGFLYTGDLGRMDEDGYLTIAGRKKCLIVTAGGKNIYPDELEAMLNENIYILESVVIPVEDRKGHTRPGAIIVPNYDVLGTIEEIKGNMSDEKVREFIGKEIEKLFANFPDYKRLIGFQIRSQELPKTSTRKVKRHLVTWIRE